MKFRVKVYCGADENLRIKILMSILSVYKPENKSKRHRFK